MSGPARLNSEIVHGAHTMGLRLGPALAPLKSPDMVAGAAFIIMPFVLVMTWALEDHGPDNLKPVRRR